MEMQRIRSCCLLSVEMLMECFSYYQKGLKPPDVLSIQCTSWATTFQIVNEVQIVSIAIFYSFAVGPAYQPFPLSDTWKDPAGSRGQYFNFSFSTSSENIHWKAAIYWQKDDARRISVNQRHPHGWWWNILSTENEDADYFSLSLSLFFLKVILTCYGNPWRCLQIFLFWRAIFPEPVVLGSSSLLLMSWTI